MHRLDLGGQRGVFPLPVRRPAITCCVVGGTGDLQQLARPLDFAPLRLLRLDERVAVHRALTRSKPRPASGSDPRAACGSPCATRTTRGAPRWPGPVLSRPRRPAPPASPIRAPRSRSGQVPRDLADRPVLALARLNHLRLELRRERTAPPGLFPMLSMIGHPSGAKP